MAVPTDMDGFSEKIGTTDTYSRLSLGDALLNYLGNNINSIECSDIGQFIDKLVPWLTCSNFKVSQKGLEIMTALVERMRNDFKPYVPTVCPAIVDRLGDSHESVREKAQALLMVFLDKEVLTPQQLFDRVGPAFSHKNSKVREEIMICLVNTINMYGSNSIALSKLTPHLVKLLADQNVHVREQAFTTLMEIYRRVGDRLRVDIQRRYASSINPARLAPLMAKMEELRESGAVLTTSDGRYEDETDRPIEKTVVKKLQTKKPPAAPLSATPLSAGAVDEEFFTNAFEDVPTVQIFSSHELKEMVISIANTIGNPEMDWDKRVDAFKRIRSLLIAGAANFEEFNDLIKKWELPFVESLKDLRSHVVRETCVTIAYLAQTLGIKFGRFAEVVFQNLINLIQSSAKVIASAGFTSMRFIIQNVHNQRLLPIINNNITSRSREIRKAMCDVLDQLIHTWPFSILEKRIPLLQEAVKRGVSDADMEARVSARRAFWAFKGYFPEQADALLATLDYSYKKSLYGDVSLSGSNQSLNQGSLTRQTSAPSRSRIQGNATGSSENLHHGLSSSQQSLHRTPSLPRARRSCIPVKTYGERSLSLGSISSPSVITSISKEDYFLNTPCCLFDSNKDSLRRYRSISSLKSTSKSSLLDKFYCSGSRKRRRERKEPSVWENEKCKISNINSSNCDLLPLVDTMPSDLMKMNCVRSCKEPKSRAFKKSRRHLRKRKVHYLRNRYTCLNRSSPSLFTQETPFLGADRLPQNGLQPNLSNYSFEVSNKNDYLVFSTLSSLIVFDDDNKMQNSLRKSPKLINNKVTGSPNVFSPLNISLKIMGNRRKDKIKIFSSLRRRYTDIKDKETMTELTGFQEEHFGLNKPVKKQFMPAPGGLKKAPKILNLNYMLNTNHLLLGQEKGKCEERLLHSLLKGWTAPKKLLQSDTTCSSKSVVCIFKNKTWFDGNESPCGSPRAEENNKYQFIYKSNIMEKGVSEESIETVLPKKLHTEPRGTYRFLANSNRQSNVLNIKCEVEKNQRQLLIGENNDTPNKNYLNVTAPDSSRVSRCKTQSGDKKMIMPGNRSNSAIDLQAAQRANARAQYAAMNRLKAGSGASLPRSRKSPEVTTVPSPERISRPRSRVSGYSQSQPTSRSASPSSHLSYHTFQTPTSRPRKLSGGGISGIPGPRSSTNSRETSRETSPTRLGSLTKLRSRGLTHMSSLDRPPSRPIMTQKILQQSREAESALADALSFEDSQSEMMRSVSKKTNKLFDDHSDESETSSVCSERSFDSLRRPSDSYSWSGSQSRIYKDFWNDSGCRDISEIIANFSRSSWSERKEGLVGLQQYLRAGNLLTPLELKRVTDIFTKMFMDSQTKAFTLFLDTLNEIIIKHQADLNDWLYILLTKLLNKLGSDVLTSIGRRILYTLTLVRENFSTELQMNEMLRFIIDPTQTHNTKVKVAALNYLAQLASEMEPSDFNPGSCVGKDPTSAALAKMINWTKSTDSKGTGEVKRAAQEAIIALFNLNPSIITMKLAELSKEHQELAANLVQSHLRHSSGGGSAPQSPAPMMPLSPSRPSMLGLKNNHYDAEAIDSDEIYKSLRRTTAEIQNYSFESKLVERDRDTTSQDSGISQMSAGPGDKMEALEERIEAIHIQGSNSAHSPSLSSPTQRIKEYSVMEKTITADALDEQDGYQEISREEEAESWKNVLQTLSGVNSEPLTSQQKEALTHLFRLVRQGSTLALTQNFRKLFKILVQLLPLIDSSQPSKVVSDVAVITQVLRTITEMFKKPALTPLFADFTELLLMKVMRLFESSHKENKEVVRYAETCCSAMATVLPVDTTLKMLNAFAHTKEHPANMYAVKTITKVVQHRNKELVLPHLKQTMTALIEAYNSEHSSVRKSVVFCIVALHGVFGEEELAPYLDKLCPSKRKLLNLYIKRQQQGTPTPPNETKNNSDKDAPPV